MSIWKRMVTAVIGGIQTPVVNHICCDTKASCYRNTPREAQECSHTVLPPERSANKDDRGPRGPTRRLNPEAEDCVLPVNYGSTSQPPVLTSFSLKNSFLHLCASIKLTHTHSSSFPLNEVPYDRQGDF